MSHFRTYATFSDKVSPQTLAGETKKEHKIKIIKKTIAALTLIAMSTGVAIADGQRIAEGSFGCTDREYRNKLISAAAEKDMEAFKKGLMAGMLRGECVMFKGGEEVFITDTAIFSGLVKVRRRGDVSEYWTNIEAVK